MNKPKWLEIIKIIVFFAPGLILVNFLISLTGLSGFLFLIVSIFASAMALVGTVYFILLWTYLKNKKEREQKEGGK